MSFILTKKYQGNRIIFQEKAKDTNQAIENIRVRIALLPQEKDEGQNINIHIFWNPFRFNKSGGR